MRKLLLATAAFAAIAGGFALVAPTAASSLGNSVSRSVCSFIPDQCLEMRRSSLESTREMLTGHRGRIQEGTRGLEEFAAQTNLRLDAIKANGQLLAQREMDRRTRNAATLEFAGRTYNPADVEAQARLWAAEEAQFTAVLNEDVAARRTQFAEARERVSLAYSRVDSVTQLITADLLLAPVTRDLARIRSLSAAADTASREVRELLDPVRSVLEMPALAGAANVRPTPARPSFDLDAWLRQQGGARPQS